MKKFFVIFLLGFSISNCNYCQSIYHFQYNFHQPDDSITYHAFFVRYDDGSGLLRIRSAYQTAASHYSVQLIPE